MRTLFHLLGALSVLGAALDGAMAALVGVLVAAGRADAGMSVEALLRNPVLPPVLKTAVCLDPGAALWVLAAPALVYFPVRIVLGLTIGAAAIYAARGASRS